MQDVLTIIASNTPEELNVTRESEFLVRIHGIQLPKSMEYLYTFEEGRLRKLTSRERFFACIPYINSHSYHLQLPLDEERPLIFLHGISDHSRVLSGEIMEPRQDQKGIFVATEQTSAIAWHVGIDDLLHPLFLIIEPTYAERGHRITMGLWAPPEILSGEWPYPNYPKPGECFVRTAA